MKYLLSICVLVLSYCLSSGQTEAQKFKNDALKSQYYAKKELVESFKSFNFSGIFTQTDNSEVFGFIGDNFQRIKIKLVKVGKVPGLAGQYVVYGKSMVKNNIDKFTGTISITNIRKTKDISYGVDDEYKNKGIVGEYSILGDYTFKEDNNSVHSGIFKGSFQTDFYLDKNNHALYDDIDNYADGYTNNQFVGTWASYKGSIFKKCNWGDYRVPESADLDIGAGDFSPNDKYLKFGWQSLRDEYNPTSTNTHALIGEKAHWWQ